jgi:hypothetical protein
MSERRLVAVSTCAGVLAGVGLSWLWRRLARRRQLIAAATATKTPGPFDMASKLSLVARAKRAAPLRELIPLGKIEGMAQMAGGTPHPSTFPVASYTLELVDGTTLRINDPAIVAKAQQYMHDVTPGLGTVGYVPLLGWIKQHVQQQHAPPCKGWEVCVCTGNSDGFQRAWEALLDPGDTLLVDELNFAFSTSQLAQWVGGRQLHVEPVPLGEHGVDPEALAAILDSWAVQKPGRRFPKALFTIPAYQNPTCKCLDLPTARAVYAACAAHGLAIIEDDPYRLLAFGDPTDEAAPLPGTRGVLPPSYLSVDTDGTPPPPPQPTTRCPPETPGWLHPPFPRPRPHRPRGAVRHLLQVRLAGAALRLRHRATVHHPAPRHGHRPLARRRLLRTGIGRSPPPCPEGPAVPPHPPHLLPSPLHGERPPQPRSGDAARDARGVGRRRPARARAAHAARVPPPLRARAARGGRASARAGALGAPV